LVDEIVTCKVGLERVVDGVDVDEAAQILAQFALKEVEEDRREDVARLLDGKLRVSTWKF
jgi:hypothetical protein